MILGVRKINGDPIDGTAGGAWEIALEDGRQIKWVNQYTGPVTLSPQQLAEICHRLLKIETERELHAAVQREFQFGPSGGNDASVLIYSATRAKNFLEADLADIADGRRPDCPAVYIEARSVYLARSNDLVCGRTAPWRAAVRCLGSQPIEVPGLEYYYLTHALLVLADRFQWYPSPAIRRLIDYTRGASLPIFRVYALDDEMSIFLLWLKRVSAATDVMVEANATEITSQWNRKTSLHPLVADASALPVSASASPQLTLRRESELTPLAQELGFLPARLPGYSIAANTPDRFYATFCAGAQLLAERYGLVRACLKPARSGCGARIVTNISLLDPAELEHLGKRVSRTEEDYVLEAQVDYLIGGTDRAALILAPSVHVLDGVLSEGVTLQFLLGPVWHGNVYIDRSWCQSFGLAVSDYDLIRREMNEFVEAFRKRGPALSLVKCGVDFAVGRVGGSFGADVLVGMQDLNLSSHGAEYLRVFRRKIGPNSYVATRVVRPTQQGDFDVLTEAMTRFSVRSWMTRVIACIPDRWGMIGAAAPSPADACDIVLQVEDDLVSQGLCYAPARR